MYLRSLLILEAVAPNFKQKKGILSLQQAALYYAWNYHVNWLYQWKVFTLDCDGKQHVKKKSAEI